MPSWIHKTTKLCSSYKDHAKKHGKDSLSVLSMQSSILYLAEARLLLLKAYFPLAFDDKGIWSPVHPNYSVVVNAVEQLCSDLVAGLDLQPMDVKGLQLADVSMNILVPKSVTPALLRVGMPSCIIRVVMRRLFCLRGTGSYKLQLEDSETHQIPTDQRSDGPLSAGRSGRSGMFLCM